MRIQSDIKTIATKASTATALAGDIADVVVAEMARGSHASSFMAARDPNGNSLLRVTTPNGAFSIQASGNLPECYSAISKGQLKKRVSKGKMYEACKKEVSEYVAKHGTTRQKALVGDL